MENVLISSHKFRKVLYDRARRSSLGIKVKSDHTLNIHTVPVDELERWRNGRSFHGSSFLKRKSLGIEFNAGMEFNSDWFLILENVSDYDADVEYDVYDR